MFEASSVITGTGEWFSAFSIAWHFKPSTELWGLTLESFLTFLLLLKALLVGIGLGHGGGVERLVMKVVSGGFLGKQVELQSGGCLSLPTRTGNLYVS